MPEPKAEWLAQLRALDDKADLRFNYAVNRWEFILTNAAGKPESQFWCRFDAPNETRDPVTGMKPYRELNDAEFALAIQNLERTFIGNPHDGAGTTRKEALRRYRWNREHQAEQFRKAGEAFADFVWDHRRQIRDAGAGPLVGWNPTARPKVEVA